MIETTALSAVEEFSARFTKQAGMLYPAKDPSDAVSIINGLIKSRGKGESCCSDKIEVSYQGSKTHISPLVTTTVTYDALKKDPRKLVGLLDVGITKADYGIAETGSIVDVSFSDESRLLSSLTRVHIAVLERNRIQDKLSMLSPIMKDFLNPSNGRKKPAITFIGGPSRTSDSELKSVLGVHGPHEVHVVLL